MDHLVFSHQQIIRAALFFQGTSLILISNSKIDVFDIGNAKCVQSFELVGKYKDLHPIHATPLKKSQHNFLIQGKMGNCLLFHVDKGEGDVSIIIKNKFAIGMVGFTRITTFIMGKQQIKQDPQEQQTNAQKFSQLQPKKSQKPSLFSIAISTYQQKVVERINSSDGFPMEDVQAFFSFNEQKSQLEIYDAQTCYCIRSYRVQLESLQMFNTMTCMAIQTSQRQAILYLGQENGKIDRVHVKMDEQNQVSNENPIIVTQSKEQGLILCLELINTQKNRIIACSIRKDPHLYIINDTLPTRVEKLKLISHPDTLITNIIHTKENILVSLNNRIYKIGLNTKEKRVVCEIKQSKIISNINIGISEFGSVIAGCSEEKQFFYIECF